jgi:WD40 repeat protein
LRAVWAGHEAPVAGALGLGRAGVVSWSDDTTLRLWRATSPAPVATLRGHGAQVNSALRLPGGRVASTAYDGSICVWAPGRAAAPLARMMQDGQTPLGARPWRRDRIVTWCCEGDLVAWDAAAGERVATLGRAAGVGAPAGVPLLVLPERDEVVTWPSAALEFWCLRTGECLRAGWGDGRPLDAVTGVLRLADGRLLVRWGQRERALRVLSSDGGRVEATLEGHAATVRGFVELADGGLASYDDGGAVVVWAPGPWRPALVTAPHATVVVEVRPLAGDRMLSRGLDGGCRVWRRATGELVASFEIGRDVGAAWSSSRYLSWSRGGLHVWCLRTGARSQSLEAPGGGLAGVAPRARAVVTWHEDRTLGAWALAE